MDIEFIRCCVQERHALNVMLSAMLDYLYPQAISRYTVSPVGDPSVPPIVTRSD